MEKVLCVVAHPDDEVLGVGGTLARHVMQGDNVLVVVVCGNSFRGEVDYVKQLRESMKCLGVKQYICLDFSDQRLDEVPLHEIKNRLALELLDDWCTSLIYTHWHKDLNRDHRIVAEVVQLIARPKRGWPYELRQFPTPSSTEHSFEGFVPDTWVALGAVHMEKKNMALQCYREDIQSELLPRNVRYMNVMSIFWGAQVGLHAAEVFKTIKRIV